MRRKVIVLLAFGCLWPAVGKGQEAPVSVTVQSPSTEAPAQTAQQSPVVLDDLLREALQKNPGVQSILRQVEGGSLAPPHTTGKDAARPHSFCRLGGQPNAETL